MLLLAALLPAVELPSTHTGPYPIKVVVTTGMIADAVRQIGGDKVEVDALMGAGIDPHQYKATAGDLRKLRGAQLIFHNGLHLEAKIGDLLTRLGKTQPVAAVTDKLVPADLISDSEVEGASDPHVWLDVALWTKCVQHVSDVLAAYDPENAAYYAQRFVVYRVQLDALHGEVKASLAQLPEKRRVLVTAHDAFNYFGRAYGVRVEGVQGLSTLSEAGVRRVNELVALLAEGEVKAVFIESSVSDRHVRALLEGAAAQGHTVKLGGELFSDAMGADGTPEGTYLGMVRHNVKTIVEGLR